MLRAIRSSVFACSALVAVSTMGCAIDEQSLVCDGETAAGLTVVVRHADTGALVCDASIDARCASYTEHLQPAGTAADCHYVGAWERAGEFTLDIERSQMRRVIVQGVEARRGECHVAGAFVHVDLSPQ